MHINSPRRALGLLALCLGVAVPGAVAVSYVADRFAPPAPTSAGAVLGSPNLVEGLRTPQAVPVSLAGLPDDEPVIGVSVQGRHRAYRLAALAPMFGHVVNDLVAQTPVTVTYCNRDDCSQVFTADGVKPLDVWTGGYMEQLMLRVNGRFFWQKSGKFVAAEDRPETALQILEHQRTTWKKWRDAYPDTDIFTGSPASTSIAGH